MAEDNQTSQDGLIHRVCVEDKGPAQSVATMTRAQRCEVIAGHHLLLTQ